MNETKRHALRGEASAAAVPWTVARLVQGMEARGDDPAILQVGEGRVEPWSYRDLADTVRRLATGLREAGLEPGEPAVLYAPNAPDWVAAALALNAAGALVVPVDDLAGDERARSVIADSGAKWIFTARAHVDALRRMPGAETFRPYLLDSPDEPAGGASSWRRLLAAAPAALPDLRPGRPACLFYTSGTTGPPKAFVLTHANIGTNVRALAAEGLVAPGDRALIPLPLHHAYPYIVGMLTSLETGMAIVLPQGVTGPHIAEALHAARVTVVVGVPRLYEALLGGLEARVAARGRLFRRLFSLLLALCVRSQRRLGLPIGPWLLGSVRRRIAPELRLLISGGARLEADLSWTLETLGWQALAGYGLAETASVFTGNLPRRKRLGSAGTPLADGQVRIAKPDETGVGEIELRGSSVTPGYRDPEANRAAFTADGWFRTGDLGYLDEDGFLFVTGRAGEVIVLGGGKKVNPEDLEKTYAANPVIGEIAVLERGGQLVGLVRPNPERLREIGTLNVEHAVRVALAEVGQGLPAYERLAGFAISARPLPRTRLGKYRRFLLPDLYDEAKRGPREAPKAELSAEDRRFLESPIAAGAWRLVRERYADRAPTLDSHLALDLGVDSLEWMGLSLELQARLGVALDEEDMARIETVRDLLATLVRAGARPRAEVEARERRMLADRERWLRPIGPALTLVGLCLFALNKILMRAVFRLRADGLERLPKTGAFLLVPNHVSDLDPLAVAAALPFKLLRRVYWGGDVVRLFGNAALRQLCRAVHLYPVDERMPVSAIETASLVLSRGNAQVWFPEAWRSPDGRLQRFLPGVGDLVVKNRAPAVPVYISGTFRAMPRTRRWPRPHRIRVVIGAPLEPGVLEARGRGESAQDRVADALQAEVRALAAAIGEEV
jgi:long-chain acyl-CoA synthetase